MVGKIFIPLCGLHIIVWYLTSTRISGRYETASLVTYSGAIPEQVRARRPRREGSSPFTSPRDKPHNKNLSNSCRRTDKMAGDAGRGGGESGGSVSDRLALRQHLVMSHLSAAA